MNVPEELQLEDLDTIKIVASNGYVKACFGLVFTFFLEQPHDKSVRLKMARCIDEYVGMTREHLKWCAGERGLDLSESEPPCVVDIVDRELDEEDSFEIGFSSGPDYEDASHYQIQSFASLLNQREKEIAYLTGTLPFSWIKKNKPGRFQAMLHKWCKTLSPYHGYAGLGIIQTQDPMMNRSSMKDIFGFAMRFPGLNVENPLSLVGRLTDSIKGVNWLTILSNEFLNKLGGEKAVKQQLNEDFIFYDYDGGTMIQAGPYPQIGDNNRGIIPEHYKQLGAIVKPIKYKCDDVYLKSPSPDSDFDYNLKKSKEWFDRFD